MENSKQKYWFHHTYLSGYSSAHPWLYTGEAEAEGLPRVQGQPDLRCKFQAGIQTKDPHITTLLSKRYFQGLFLSHHILKMKTVIWRQMLSVRGCKSQVLVRSGAERLIGPVSGSFRSHGFYKFQQHFKMTEMVYSIYWGNFACNPTEKLISDKSGRELILQCL